MIQQQLVIKSNLKKSNELYNGTGMADKPFPLRKDK